MLSSSSRCYKYYDSPDGYDLLLKTEYLCRKIAAASFTVAMTDVIAITQPKTYFSIAERFIRVFVPPIIGGAIFTTSVYMATNIRKRDDSWNHVLGCFMSTWYASRMYKHTPGIWILAFPFTVAVIIYKDMKMLQNAQFHRDEIDNLMNLGGLVIQHDMKRDSIYGDKKSFLWSDWFN